MEKGKNVIICEGAVIGDNVVLGDNVYIDIGVIIRDNVSIGAGTFIGARCIIGEYLSDFFEDHINKSHRLSIGENAIIRSETIIYGDSEIGDEFQTGHRVTIREKSKIGNHVRIGTLSDVQGFCEIQDYVNMHSNVHIGQKSLVKKYAWIFPYSVLTNDPNPPSENLIGAIIEEFAIVATGSIVLAGIKVGKEALVGAGAIVTKDVASGKVVVGAPAKEISDVTEIKNKVTGEAVYPWRYHFDRGMPWKGVGYDQWEQKVRLRRLMNKDAEGMLEWMHDHDLCAGFRFDGSNTTREDVENFIFNSMSSDNKHYAIVNNEDEYLGTISLKKIKSGMAEYAIALRKRAVGIGVAKQATMELMQIAFEELNLKKIYLNVLTDNIRAIKLYEKVGFIYKTGSDSEIVVKGHKRQLRWYAIERCQYEEIRRSI